MKNNDFLEFCSTISKKNFKEIFSLSKGKTLHRKLMAASSETSSSLKVIELSRNYRVFDGETLVRSSVPNVSAVTVPDFSKEVNNSIAWKAVDCTIIVVWNHNGLWKVSSNKKIDILDFTTPGHTNTFREMLADVGFKIDSFPTLKDDRTYLFRLIHPGTQRVCKPQAPKIDFLYSFKSTDEIVDSVDFSSPIDGIAEAEKFEITNFEILRDMDPYNYTGLIVMTNSKKIDGLINAPPFQYQAISAAIAEHEALFGYRTPYASFYAAEKTEENEKKFLIVYPHLAKHINLFFHSNLIDNLILVILTSIDPRITGGSLSKFTEAAKTKTIPRPLHIFLCKFMNEFRFSPILEFEHVKKLVKLSFSKITPELIAEILRHAADFT